MSFIRFASSCRNGLLAALFIAASLSVGAQENPSDSSYTPGILNGNTTAASPARPTGHSVTLSDFGAEDIGYLAVPITPPTVGIVLVPDAYGLDDFTKREADRLAGEGYLACAVDIYNGKLTTDPGQLANLVENLDGPTVMKTVDAGVRLFHESPKFRVPHVVMVGWGVGANYVWQATSDKNAPDGAILFYGPVESAPVKKCPVPVCALYSDRDPKVTREAVLDFQHALRDVGSDFTAWFIAAAPGWSNPQSPAYNPVEDSEAWKVADPFIVRIAAAPVKKDSKLDKVKDSVESLLHKL
jgi:carboxymethylenebutenolidase